MLAIDVRDLRKQFNVQKNREGIGGALRDLFKREYTEVTAVKDISFQIPQGEICGYIGENGAGKSTTIKMLTGILVPTSGHIKVNGFVPHKEREKFVQGIGVVFGQRSQLWWDIGVIESFRLLRKVYGVGENDFKRLLDELVETLSLGELLNRPVRKLSLGQRMRCELAAALLHNPSILFLDEPTIGLDIVVKTEIREFLKRINRERGTTILLTTHDLQDIEALCSRVIMLDDGRIIYDGGLEELKTRWGKGREVVFTFGDAVRADRLAALTEGMDVRWSLGDAYTATVWIPLEINVSEVLSRVVGTMEISDIKIIETNTEEIVREIYRTGSAQTPAEALAAGGPVGRDDGEGGGGASSGSEKEAGTGTMNGAGSDTVNGTAGGEKSGTVNGVDSGTVNGEKSGTVKGVDSGKLIGTERGGTGTDSSRPTARAEATKP